MKISTGLPLFNTPVDPQGTENQSANAIFHAGSKSLMSHVIDVSETPIIVKAYGFLNDASTITVWTVTTEIGNVTIASPMVLNGRHVQLSNRNNVLVIDMTGKYKFQLSDGLGLTTCAYHESGLSLWSFGLSAFAVANGMLEFVDTETTHVEMVENQVKVYLKKSNAGGNLIQVRGNNAIPDDPDSGSGTDVYGPEGIYYGLDAGKFAFQYVSSTLGSDSDAYYTPPGTNDGSHAKPWKTIGKALEHLPDGTQGVIYLYRGDTFNTIPTAYSNVTNNPADSIDVVNNMTLQESLGKVMSTGNRTITFAPYDDACIDAISAWNNTHGTVYVPFLANQINFPIINFTIAQPTDIWPGNVVVIGFSSGPFGYIGFRGIKFKVGQFPTANPGTFGGALWGYGRYVIEGGSTQLGSVPFVLSGDVLTWAESFHTISDHTVATVGGPIFCRVVNRTLFNTVGDSGGTSPYDPANPVTLPYTYHANNVESFLVDKNMWPGLTILGPPSLTLANGSDLRAYARITTSIRIA